MNAMGKLLGKSIGKRKAANNLAKQKLLEGFSPGDRVYHEDIGHGTVIDTKYLRVGVKFDGHHVHVSRVSPATVTICICDGQQMCEQARDDDDDEPAVPVEVERTAKIIPFPASRIVRRIVNGKPVNAPMTDAAA
jgi:hypothetical protein